MKYLWADTHFGHAKIIEFTKRPFANVEEMNEVMVTRWNSTVRPGDEIYLLGDFSFEKDPAPTFARLNGKKHLVIGNHDESRRAVLELGWESVSHLTVVREEGARVVCCHYPIESWPQAHRGYLMAHGHTHGTLKRILPHRFDVGFDEFPWPLAVQELAKIAELQTFNPTDHHGDL